MTPSSNILKIELRDVLYNQYIDQTCCYSFLAHLSQWLTSEFIGYVGLRRLSSVVVRRRPHSLNTFSSEAAGPVKVKFHMELLWEGGTKVQTVLVTWPRWPPCPYMIKTLKDLLLENPKADDFETWYAASSARVLPSLFKWWPCVDLDLFYGKVKFGPLCFCMGKK